MYIAVKLVCEAQVVASISNSIMFHFVSILFTKLVKNTCKELLTTCKSLIQKPEAYVLLPLKRKKLTRNLKRLSSSEAAILELTHDAIGVELYMASVKFFFFRSANKV